MAGRADQTADALWDEAPVPLCLVDADGCVVRANRAWQALGHSLAELVGTRLLERVAPAAREAFEGAVAAAREGRPFAALEADLLVAGAVRPMRWSGCAVGDAWVQLAAGEPGAADEPACGQLQLADILEFAHDMVQSVAPDGRFLYVNRAWLETLGYSAAEVPSLSLFDIIHPDSLEHCAQVFERVLAGQECERVEAAFRAKDGRVIWVEGSASCRFDGDRPVATRAIFRDITARREREELLRYSEERHRRLSDGLRAVLGLVDELMACADLTILFRRAVELARERLGVERCAIFVLAADEVRGTFGTDRRGRTVDERELRFPATPAWERRFRLRSPFDLLWDVADEPWVEFRDGRSVEFGHGWVASTVIQTRDAPIGVLVNDAAISGAPFDPTRQEVIAVYCSLLATVAATVLAQQALAEAESAERAALARLNAVLAAATQVAIIATDEAGVITVFNSGAERMLGYRAAEMIGRATPLAFHLGSEVEARAAELTRELGRPVEGFEAFVAKAREEGSEEREWTYVRRDGRPVTVHLAVTAKRDEQGHISGYLGVATDITERKRFEEQLLIARDQAEAANRAKSEFLATMSHEIRTPMNGVIGMIGLLLATELTAEQREYATTVRSSAEALLAVLNDILDFAKVEAGRLAIERVPFSLRDVIRDAVELQGLRAAAKGLEVVVRYPTTIPPRVIGDPVRLRQVLGNYLSNAVKFTDRGHIVVDVRHEPLAGERFSLRVAVEDTGIGVAPEQLERLFERFTQADGSTTRRYGGTGLGLAISRQLVELMGGRVGATSRLGQGSTFWFEVPLEPAPGAVENAAQRLPSGRVLIVGAVEALAGQLADVLAVHGLAVLVCSAPEDARTALGEAGGTQPVDLILVDAGVAGGEGLEVGRELGERAGPATAVVLLVPAGTRIEAERWLQAGIAGFLTKPIWPWQLVDVAGRLLTGEQPPGELVTVTRAEPRPEPGEEALARHGLRVLLVEDNAINQQVAARWLERLGCEVVTAGDGAEALVAVEEGGFDIVFMDCRMPTMDGFEATRAIREREGGQSRLPIVAMTASALSEDRERCLAAGMDDFLAKPIELSALRLVLERWCGGRCPTDAESAALGGLVFDPTVLTQLGAAVGERDERFAQKIVRLYLGELPAMLAAIHAAVAASDATAVHHASHRLKGASANVGLHALVELCGELEEAGREGRTDLAATLCERLDESAGRAEAVLRRWLSSGGGQGSGAGSEPASSPEGQGASDDLS